jgi:hypothetical protein
MRKIASDGSSWDGRCPDLCQAGLLGEKFGVYEEPRANERIYQHVPRFARGTVNYAAFSVLDTLTFEPDLLILMATPSQAEIVLRAMSYSTGELWQSIKTPVLSCAWIFAYPWLTGKVNHIVTGMAFARTGLPEFDPISILGQDTGDHQSLEKIPGIPSTPRAGFRAEAGGEGGEEAEEAL